MMYLYDTPRDTMSKDSMLQMLCSTSTWKAPGLMPNTSNYLFMCSKYSHSIQMINHSSPPKLLTQHKSSITQVLQSFPLNTKHLINHVLQGPHPTHANMYIHIYIYICNWLMPSISNKSSSSYEMWYLTEYIKIKHQVNIIINGAHSHKC